MRAAITPTLYYEEIPIQEMVKNRFKSKVGVFFGRPLLLLTF